jgi:hypothetical protein
MLSKACQRFSNWLNDLFSGRGQRISSTSDADADEEGESCAKNSNPVWCLVANVVESRNYGETGEVRSGTKHFPPGAKVYCFPMLWGDGYERVKVVGRHRGSHRYVTMIVRSEHLTNWRAKLIYSPEVIRRLEGHWDGSAKSKEEAENYVRCMQRRERGEEENIQASDQASDTGPRSFVEKLLGLFNHT